MNWHEIERTEPPLTRAISDEIIAELSKTGDKPDGLIPLLPCHTQAVERHIKVVTEASSAVEAGERDGFIRTRLLSRSKIPKFE